MSTTASSPTGGSTSATPSQRAAAIEIYRIATTTTAAQREPLRPNITIYQREMGLPPSLADGLIGRSTARAVFDLTGRRIPGIEMAATSPLLTTPGTPAPVAPAPHGGTGTAPAPHGGTGTAPAAPALSIDLPVQGSIASQVQDAGSFFDRHKTLLLVTAGLVVATGVAAYLMTSAEGEKSAMDNATVRYAARMLGISPDSDVQSIRAAAARALQAYPDDETRRNAIIEARDVMIRARSQGSPSGRSVSSRGREMSYQIVTSGLRGR